MATVGLPAEFLAALGSVAPTAVEDTGPEEDALTASAPGTLTSWLVEDGAEVAAGQDVAVVEAMKMEARVAAHRAGTLRRVAEQGAAIGAGEVLARIG